MGGSAGKDHGSISQLENSRLGGPAGGVLKSGGSTSKVPCYSGLICEQNSQVAQVITGRASLNRIAERAEQGISVEFGERCINIEALLPCSFRCASIGQRTRRGTVPVDTVGSRAKQGDVFARNFFGAGQRKLLVPTAHAAICHFDCDLSTGNQAHALRPLSQLAQTLQQIISRLLVTPVITGIIHVHRESRGAGRDGSFLDRCLVR